MILSMTGFGRGESVAGGYRFLAEVKAVNHRFLNTSMRLPRDHARFESGLAARCAERCERGHLHVRVEMEPDGGSVTAGPRVQQDVVDRFVAMAEGLSTVEGVIGGLTVEGLLALPGVVDWEPDAGPVADDVFLEGAGAALDKALDGLVESRSTEGRALDQDFRARLDRLDELAAALAVRAPEREVRERERLRAKVDEILTDAGDMLEQRIAQEIVLLADRVDVSEELTRFHAHLDHFRAELDSDGGAVGRKLTFLLQELNREANTIGSKAGDPDMRRMAVEMKAELEKMREQAENVE